MEEQNIKLTKLTKCAGCGAKVGAGVLAQLLEGIRVHHDPNLLVGFDKSDDASVYKINDELALVQTVDFFPPIADDPYLFGQIAATNALSDVYAMGGVPKLCLNIMAVPEDMPRETVHQILRGGYDKVYEAGALITGGHSILDDEPKYGLAVTGFVHPDKLLSNSAARPGDARDADAEICADDAADALGHFPRGLRGDGAVRGERRVAHADEALLDLVRIGDDGAHNVAGAAGDVRETARHEAARTGLRAGDGLAGRAKRRAETRGELVFLLCLHASSTLSPTTS